MTRREAFIGLNLLYDIGSRRAQALCAFFKEPQAIFPASVDALCKACGVSVELAQRIRGITPQRIHREMERVHRQGITVITVEDEAYPAALRTIYDPPLALYVKGNLDCFQKRSFAVVGSRRASFYGQKHARQFAAALVEAGFCIVSGMARGIDTCAHQGALDAGGATVAVMGSGFNDIYPPENRRLAQRIAESGGAVVTEFSMDTAPLKANFPRRNRIISGLSEGVLVIEAARTSGALITADCALEQGREVFALPGQVDSVTADGTNALISQGAQVALAPADIIDALSFSTLSLPAAAPSFVREEPKAASRVLSLNADERALRDLFTTLPCAIDELVEKSGMDISRISAILLALQIKKIINQLPGKYYQLAEG